MQKAFSFFYGISSEQNNRELNNLISRALFRPTNVLGTKLFAESLAMNVDKAVASKIFWGGRGRV